MVHCRTCGRCLARHGEIFADLSLAPPLHPGCRCSYLEFAPDEEGYYREKAKRMKAKAEQELQRRELFQRAARLLQASPAEALDLFRQAAEIDVYLEEVESLCRELPPLASHRDLAKRLRDVFVYGYQNRFTKQKYAPFPEGMRWALERAGVERIKELFHDLIAL